MLLPASPIVPIEKLVGLFTTDPVVIELAKEILEMADKLTSLGYKRGEVVELFYKRFGLDHDPYKPGEWILNHRIVQFVSNQLKVA